MEPTDLMNPANPLSPFNPVSPISIFGQTSDDTTASTAVPMTPAQEHKQAVALGCLVAALAVSMIAILIFGGRS